MWRLFLNLVRHVENEIVRTQGHSADALSAVAVLTNLRGQLCQQGLNNGAWLSTVRNNLNYRQDYGVWYPYSVTSRFAADLLNRMSRWTPGDANGYGIGPASCDLAGFVDACNVVSKLLTSALADVARRAPSPQRSFVGRKPFKLLRLRNLNV
jgi:hypothetical protein